MTNGYISAIDGIWRTVSGVTWEYPTTIQTTLTTTAASLVQDVNVYVLPDYEALKAQVRAELLVEIQRAEDELFIAVPALPRRAMALGGKLP